MTDETHTFIGIPFLESKDIVMVLHFISSEQICEQIFVEILESAVLNNIKELINLQSPKEEELYLDT